MPAAPVAQAHSVTAPAGDAGQQGHEAHGGAPSSHGARAGQPEAPGIVIDHTGHAVLPPAGGGGYARHVVDYALPDATLRDQTGRLTTLAEALDHDGPLLMNFVFTSCTTICPVMSATFGEMQAELSEVRPGYRMVSITIDPEYDTPSRLRDYAKLHEAGPQWTFLTGDAGEIRKVIAAFDAIYRADNKMYHLPYTYMRPAGGRAWLRLDGLLSGSELIEEYRAMLGPVPAPTN